MKLAIVATSALLFFLSGCDSCKGSSTQTAASASGSASGAPMGSGGQMGKMAHCPSEAIGATTTIDDVEGGVQLSVTATDAAVVADIRARSRALAEAVKSMPATVQHTGERTGGGITGRCPVVMRDTKVVFADIDNGSRITMTPDDPGELDWLRRETRERNANLKAPGAEGAGVGKMANCPNAVAGATTTITDTKDGTKIVVVAKDPAAVKDIRARAQHLVEVAKSSDAGASHTGAGSGGGGLGRCPVIVQDTLVEAKDVEGGSMITVKPEKPADLAKIQREAHDRGEKFALGADAGSGPPAKP